MPLLDTKLLPRLASGRKHETYFPIAVADHKFHCIILKGGDKYPYFPRPLLSEFDFSIPLSSPPKEKEPKQKKKKKQQRLLGEDGELNGELPSDEEMEDDDDDGGGDDDADVSDVEVEDVSETKKLEQTFLLKGVQAAQTRDLVDATTGAHAQRSLLARLELEMDKTLLQLLAVECREGEERGMRALEMVRLMRDRTGRMMEAAGKVAERYGRTVLGDKIREVGERRVAGEDEDDV